MALDLNFLKKKYEEMLGGAGNAVMTGAANVQKWLESPTSRVNIPVPVFDPVTQSYKSVAESILTETPKTMYDISKALAGMGAALTGHDTSSYQPTSNAGKFGQELVTTGVRVGQGQKLSDVLFDTLGNYGQGKMSVPFTNIRLPEFGLSESTGARLGIQGIKSFESPIAAMGAANPVGMLGYSLLGGGLNAGGNILFSEQKDPLKAFYEGTMESAKKAPLMVGGMKATNQYLERLGGLPAQSVGNVVQGVGLDVSAGFETTPESMLLDLIMPGASKLVSKGFGKLANRQSVKTVVQEIKDTGTVSDKAIIDTVKDMNEAGANVNVQEVKNLISQPETKAQIQSQPRVQPKPIQTTTPDVETYLNNLDTAKTKIEKVGIKQRIKSGIQQVQSKFEDYTTAIDNALSDAYKNGKLTKDETGDLHRQIGRIFKIDGLIEMYVKDNGLAKVLQDIGNERKQFDEYLIAKQALDLEGKGITTGRNADLDRGIIDARSSVYEPMAQQVYAYNRKLLQDTVNYGLISQDLADKLLRLYPNYVPMQRVFDVIEEEAMRPRDTRGGPASISSQTVIQKIQGSEREIKSPLDSILENTTLTIKQGERNIAANMLGNYIKQGILPGNILRNAENVIQRTELYREAKDLGKYKRQTERLLTTRNRWARKLVSQINYLNEKGYKIALKSEPQDVVYKPDVTLKTKTPASMVVTDTGDSFYVPYEGGAQRTLISKMPTATQTRKLVNALVNLEPAQLAQIKKRIGIKDKQLNEVISTIQDLRAQIDDIKTQRASTVGEARSLSDISTQGKHTFSALNNGIKETFETSPEIARAAKDLGTEELPTFLKFISIPMRVLQVGATGLNPAFVLANLVKDQIFSGVTSKHPMNTSLLNPAVFMKALYASTGNGELYDEWMRSGSAFTSFDISRKGLPVTVERIQSQKNFKTRATYIAKHPGELLRTVEDIVGTTERLTRIQQYEGTKKALLDQGVELNKAKSMAAEASRVNTGDFSRHGEWGRYLNAIIPFFGAGIQGARSLRTAFMNDPKGTSARFATLVGTPVVAATAWNILDPERKQVYDDIQEYEKESNIIFVIPGSTQNEKKQYSVIKIPLTPGLSNLASIIRRQVEGLNQFSPQGLAQVVSDLITAGTSITPPIGADNTRAFINQIMPQSFKIPLEGLTNQNLYTGNEIVPSYMKNLPPEQQVYENTSGSARIIGKAIGQSPLMVNNMISTTFGGLGRQGLNASDTILAKAGIIPESQIGGKSVLEDVTGRFSKAAGGKLTDDAYKMIADQKAGKDMTGKQITLPGSIQTMGGTSTTPKKLTSFERDAIKFNLENSGSEYLIQNGIGYYIGDNGDMVAIDPSKFKVNSSDDTLVKKDKKSALITMTKKIYTDNNLSQDTKIALLSSLGANGDTVYQAAYGIDEITNMKDDTEINKLRKLDAAFSKTNAIMKDLESGALDEDNAMKLLSSMGVKPEDASYHYIASFDKTVRTAIIEQNMDQYTSRSEWLNSLIPMRRSVNGKMILNSEVITELYNDDLITKDEKKLLNAIEIDENGNPSIKKSSGLGSGSGGSKTASKAMGTALVNASKATRRTTKSSVTPVKQKDYSNYKPAKVVPVNASRASMPTPKIKLRKVSK